MDKSSFGNHKDFTLKCLVGGKVKKLFQIKKFLYYRLVDFWGFAIVLQKINHFIKEPFFSFPPTKHFNLKSF